MKRKYVLWLDESGDFADESNKAKSKLQGSLVGGFLLSETNAERVRKALNEGKLIDSSRDNHAMTMTCQDKIRYVLPVLDKMAFEYNAIQVIFENRNYEEGKNVIGKSRSEDLYLRIIAGGLLRLLRYLDAICESVTLDVLIAHRMDKGTKGSNIEDYKEYIRRVIEEKRREGNIKLKKDTDLKIRLDYATSNQFLQLADFVCNTRLTRRSIEKDETKIYSSAVNRQVNTKQFLEGIYNDGDRNIIYPLEEEPEEYIIERMMSGMNIADAIIEFFQTKKILSNKQRVLNGIFSGIRNTNYRILKSQMKTLSRKITSLVESMDNYEGSEAFLQDLGKTFIERLKKTEAPYIQLEFNIKLMLADCYLREGDTPKAHTVLDECRRILDESDYSMEELFLYYQLLEKESLLAIDEFDYERAVMIIKKAERFLKGIVEAVKSDEYLNDKFSTIRCEYYGDALCMHLLAMMSLQRLKPELYYEMVKISDESLKQYPKNPAELERHRQYRAFIENEHGDSHLALKWLMKAKCEEIEGTEPNDIQYFLKEICKNEINISCQWYLMYYLLIMEEASKKDKEFANSMFNELCYNKRLLEIAYIVKEEPSENYQKIQTENVSENKAPFIYHPLEIVYWKWGSYLYNNTSRKDEGKKYIKKAVDECFPKNYTTYRDREGYIALNIKGIAIYSEYIAIEKGNINGNGLSYRDLLNRTERLLNKSEVSDAAKVLIRRMQGLIVKAKTGNTLDCDKLIEASRVIPF